MILKPHVQEQRAGVFLEALGLGHGTFFSQLAVEVHLLTILTIHLWCTDN